MLSILRLSPAAKASGAIAASGEIPVTTTHAAGASSVEASLLHEWQFAQNWTVKYVEKGMASAAAGKA